MKGPAVLTIALCLSALLHQHLAEATAVLGSSATERPVTPRSTTSSAAITKPAAIKQKMISVILGSLTTKIAGTQWSTISPAENDGGRVTSGGTMAPVSTSEDNGTAVTSGSTVGPVSPTGVSGITVTRNSTMDPVSTTEDIGSPQTTAVAGPPMPDNGVQDRAAEPIVIINGRKATIPMANILKMVGRPFSCVSTENTTVQNEIVEAHNTFRRAVDPPASNMLKMKWNADAAATAANWAKGCNQNRHSFVPERTIKDFTCGENLFMSSFLADWSDVIASFNSEKEDFEYGSVNGSKNENQVGHYTQLVWYKSFQVGCALSMCPNKDFLYYYVCHYCPPGNTINMFGTPYKKGEPCGDCPDACDNKLCTNSCNYQDKYNNCATFLNADGSCTGDDLIQDCPASCKCKATDIK